MSQHWHCEINCTHQPQRSRTSRIFITIPIGNHHEPLQVWLSHASIQTPLARTLMQFRHQCWPRHCNKFAPNEYAGFSRRRQLLSACWALHLDIHPFVEALVVEKMPTWSHHPGRQALHIQRVHADHTLYARIPCLDIALHPAKHGARELKILHTKPASPEGTFMWTSAVLGCRRSASAILAAVLVK